VPTLEEALAQLAEAQAEVATALDDQRDVMRENVRAMGELVRAVGDGQRDTGRALAAIGQSLAGSLQATVVVPREDATIYRGGTGTFTTTGTITAWDPSPGTRFLLKGFLVTIVVSDTLAAADEVLFYFADDADSDRVVAPIGAAVGNAAAGTIITRDVPDLGSGRLGSAADSNLLIRADIDITTGDVKVVWECWGHEVVI
jgi:hypothetical protein